LARPRRCRGRGQRDAMIGLSFSVCSVGVIARNTVREAVRQRVLLFISLLALSLVLGAQWLREFNFGASELRFIVDFGFGAMAFFGATLRSGAQIVIDAVKLRDRLTGADLCITGEGCLDRQSLSGKTPVAVARLCAELGVKCLAIAGQVELSSRELIAERLSAVSIASCATSHEQSMRYAAQHVELVTYEFMQGL